MDTNKNSTLDKKGNPNVFLLPDSEHLCDPNPHDKFIHRDTTKFLKVTKCLNSLQYITSTAQPNKLYNIITQFTVQDTTEKQRLYNGGIKRAYTLKTTAKTQGTNNLPLLQQALPDKIEWPTYPYYKVAGNHLKQPKDWPLPEEPQPAAVKHDFTTISPTKPFKPSFMK
jgi:hypothetical protein